MLMASFHLADLVSFSTRPPMLISGNQAEHLVALFSLREGEIGGGTRGCKFCTPKMSSSVLKIQNLTKKLQRDLNSKRTLPSSTPYVFFLVYEEVGDSDKYLLRVSLNFKFVSYK